MEIRVGMVSLGCPKNQVDGEVMLGLLREDGFTLVEDAALADAVIINTCGFIEDAKRESIENILEFIKLKEEGRIQCIVVTGCLAERYRGEMAEEIPEADVILGLGNNKDIASAIRSSMETRETIRVFDDKYGLPLDGRRVLTTQPFTAYLKIAEGCSNNCTYCAIPMIRGGFRSREMAEILEEARDLAGRGVKEVVLIAQDTSRYGEDLYGKSRLAELLEELAQIEEFHWIRVLYCYPERINDKLLAVMASYDNIVNYLDIPLQHCNSRVLKKMNRSGDRESLLELLRKIRERVPGIVLRTSLIAGFPSETEEEFADLSSFVEEAAFERLGCFAYSQEEGTPAAKMDGQVDEETKRSRADHVMEMQYEVNLQWAESQLDQTLEVLVEGYDRYAECYFGRSRADAPEIDFKVFIYKKEPLQPGQFVQVKILDRMDLDLLGELI